MSRRIETGPRPGMLGAARPTQEEFLGRLAKYIPAEIVGLYLAASAPVPKTDGGHLTLLWIIFGTCLLLTPLYMIFVTNDPQKGPLWLQVVLATIAFPVWVFAIGGPFAFLSWYRGYIATIVLVFVSFVFGWVKPKAGS